MPESPGSGLDHEFKTQTAAELKAIKRRLIWLLLPSFLLVAAMFGVTFWTFLKVTDIQLQSQESTRAIGSLRNALQNKQATDQTKPIFLSNGLSDTERTEFYHLAEGSEVFPLDWLRALERAETGNLFLQDAESMGFIRDPNNSDGLPVGLTAAEARGLEPLGKMVGLNCAACHVGEMTYKGARIRIDGAPNVLDTRTFFKSLIESSFATLQDADKLIAFINRLKEERADQRGAEPKVRTAARRIFDSLADRGEEALIRNAIVPAIKKIIDDEKASKELDLAETVGAPAKDAKSLRARLLDRYDSSRTKKILEASGVKARLEALVKDVDHESALGHMLEEAYIGVRLLKARAVFLKKLGMVGTNPGTVWGPGRVDAFGSARAFLFQDGYQPVNPVSYPFIWGLYRTDWFHYDNNTTSILQRNFGQALGVGAVYDPKTLASSAHPRNLYRLEALATKIRPPAWPSDVLGKIDQDAARRGEAHYTKHCVQCHKTPDAGAMFKDQIFDVEKIGTDPFRAKMFAEKLPDGKPFYEAIGDAMNKIMEKSFTDNNVTKEERDTFAKAPFDGSKVVKVEWRGPGKYSSRPLDGVWATGPFLHNGSVPTMYDLLLPAKDRPVQFYVGNREFDPAKLGYVSTPPPAGKTNFDTRTDGNRNIGHEYGTTLSDPERMDLLEYLKSL